MKPLRSRAFWPVILTLTTMLLASCGEDGLLNSSTATPRIVVSTPTPIPLPPNPSTAARIRAHGYIRIGVRYDDEPFGMITDRGDLVGFDVDLAHEFARRWLGNADAVKFVQVTDASVTERILTGQVDLVIGALTRQQSAAKDVAFSAPYYYDGLALAVPSPAAITETIVINGPQDLNEYAVGVVDGADTAAPLLRVSDTATPNLITYPDYFSAVAGLENGVIQAVVGPRRTLERLISGSGDFGVTPRFTRDAYVIGVPKQDGPLRDLVNGTLMGILGDGTYQRLFAQWFANETPPELEVWTGTSHLSFGDLSDTLVPAPDTIQDIESRGSLVVGLIDNQLPFSDFDANGVGRGFEAELARAFSGRWLGDVTAVQFVRHTEETGLAALQAGQIDLLAGHLPHTLPREDEIDFSQTIYQGGIGVLVSAASGVNSLAGLNVGTVAVPEDGFTTDAVQSAAIPAGISIAVETINDDNQALAGITDGRYLGFAKWRSELLNLAYTNPGFLVLDERLTTRPIALGIRQYDAAFEDLVNLTLQALAVDGVFAAVYDDWFGTDPPFSLEIWSGSPYRPLRLRRQPGVVATPAP